VTGRHVIAAAAVLALLFAFASDADAKKKKPQKIKVAYVEDRGVVQPGATDGFTETCPAKAPHALSGYFGTDSEDKSPHVTLSTSAPAGKVGGRSWIVGVRNMSDQPQTYFVGATCASGGPFVGVSDTDAVEAGKTGGADEVCPASAPHQISGYFYPTTDDTGQLSLVASDPASGRAWTMSLLNNTATPQPFVIGAVCAGPKVKVGYFDTDKFTVDPSTVDGAKGTCNSKAPHAVGGSFGIPSEAGFGGITIADSFPTDGGRSWITAVTPLLPTAQDYFAGMVCIG
jgi:hypothetical protein